MGDKALQHAKPRTIFADHRARFVSQHFLISAGLEELSDPKPAGVARRFFGWQRVVGADHFIAVSDIGAWTEKQRAVVFHVVEEIIWIARHHLDVLRRHTIGFAHHFRLVLAYDNLAVIGPGF